MNSISQHESSHAHRNRNNPAPEKSTAIMVYTTAVCLSCLYLQTQHFQYILNDRKAYYMGLITYIDVFLCIFSYVQTIRITNVPPKLKARPLLHEESQKFFDFSYSLDKICEVCNTPKWPRVSHCRTCGTCIYKLDHHCVWTQTCIGYKNQKSFLLFCFYMTIGVLQFWYFTIRVLRQHQSPLFDLMQPGVCLVWILTAFSAFFIGMMIIMLFLSHLVMALTNHRTLDNIKTKSICPLPFFQKGSKDPNLFDRGEIQNIKELFCSNGWWLWWLPLEREVTHDFFPEAMAPHPNRLELMKETKVYEIEQTYHKYMHILAQKNLGNLFIGKQIKINDEIVVFKQCNEII